MKVHIYQISKLYKQDAARWEEMLEQIENERKRRFFSYKALREAILVEMENPHGGQVHLEKAFAGRAQSPQDKAIRENSYLALNTFVGKIRPKLESLETNFLIEKPGICRWQGHELLGGFHFSAFTRKGDLVYVYLSASNFDDENDRDVLQRKAIIELLNIVAENRFKIEPKCVWFVDLRTGRIHKPSKSIILLRKDLRRTIDLLAACLPDPTSTVHDCSRTQPHGVFPPGHGFSCLFRLLSPFSRPTCA